VNLPQDGACDDVLLRGGVVFNEYWVERLLHHCKSEFGAEIEKISTLESVGINEESWENAMYAMFGYLCYSNIYNFVPSCTGAARKVVGGRIAPGENFGGVVLQPSKGTSRTGEPLPTWPRKNGPLHGTEGTPHNPFSGAAEGLN